MLDAPGDVRDTRRTAVGEEMQLSVHGVSAISKAIFCQGKDADGHRVEFLELVGKAEAGGR